MPVPEPNLKSETAIKETRKAFPDLSAKLKASEPEIQNYVTALEQENLKLHRTIAKQRAQYLSLESQTQVRAEEEAARRVEESELIAQAEREVTKRMKRITPLLKRMTSRDR